MIFARTVPQFSLPLLRRPQGGLRGPPLRDLRGSPQGGLRGPPLRGLRGPPQGALRGLHFFLPENFGIFSRNSSRCFSQSTTIATWKLANLKTRSVLKVNGKDSAIFLQGLITNDVHLLDASEDGGPRSIYTFMLNIQGRILFDLLIYNDSTYQDGGFLVECDALMQDKLVKHLKMYKLRKEVVIELAPSHTVHAIFPENAENALKLINQSTDAKKGEVIVKQINQSTKGQNLTDPVKQINQSVNGLPVQFRDPRLSLLGRRLVVGEGAVDLENFTKEENIPLADEIEYRRFRYQLGVAEGSLELPPGECFPSESNGDYLAGVHFHKGCYIGQELTARTHHTGVVRKRLMPVVIEGLAEGESLAKDSPISVGVEGKSVGKLRAHLGSYGIALMRISEALAAETLVVSQGGKILTVRVRKPEWWPDPH